MFQYSSGASADYRMKPILYKIFAFGAMCYQLGKADKMDRYKFCDCELTLWGARLFGPAIVLSIAIHKETCLSLTGV